MLTQVLALLAQVLVLLPLLMLALVLVLVVPSQALGLCEILLQY